MTDFELISKEAQAARKECVWFAHPNRGIIEITGKDRISFLHNILSNDIKNLSKGKGISACLLSAQAKIIAQMNVLCFDKYIWLACDYGVKNKLFDAMAKLLIMEEVEIKDRSEELQLISIHGPKSETFLKTISQKIPNELLAHEKMSLNGKDGILIRINLTGEIGFGLLVHKTDAEEFKNRVKNGGVEIHLETLDALRIEAGIPKYGVDFDESNIPLEVRLENTVSFAKGCFPGQEIIARLDSRGGVVRKLVGIISKGEIAPKKGDLIFKDGREAGTITSSVFSPTLKKTIAFGYLSKDSWAAGTPVVVKCGENEIPARVSELPFYTSIMKG